MDDHGYKRQVAQREAASRQPARSVALLRGVLEDALGLLVEAAPVDVARLPAFPGGGYLDDTPQLVLPDAWQSVWDGGATAAALKRPTPLGPSPGQRTNERDAGTPA
jgi:hypothetical protein